MSASSMSRWIIREHPRLFLENRRGKKFQGIGVDETGPNLATSKAPIHYTRHKPSRAKPRYESGQISGSDRSARAASRASLRCSWRGLTTQTHYTNWLVARLGSTRRVVRVVNGGPIIYTLHAPQAEPRAVEPRSVWAWLGLLVPPHATRAEL